MTIVILLPLWKSHTISINMHPICFPYKWWYPNISWWTGIVFLFGDLSLNYVLFGNWTFFFELFDFIEILVYLSRIIRSIAKCCCFKRCLLQRCKNKFLLFGCCIPKCIIIVFLKEFKIKSTILYEFSRIYITFCIIRKSDFYPKNFSILLL